MGQFYSNKVNMYVSVFSTYPQWITYLQTFFKILVLLMLTWPNVNLI